ncbi:leucyl aminopeptidase family protein [Albibacillus kandeliae]|uniref:leucyl aminopeptidase family protein n=1 Tax=Albibacillus kandeliae TaxID=2174228 RepID=UPI000D693CB7|nr:leucyl aminopeptidase family protein [Albibacillus kandeliae]
MPLTFAAPTPESIPLHIVEPGGLENWLLDRSEAETAWVRLNGFTGKIGQTLLVPTEGGATLALAGFGTAKDRARTRYALAAAATKLPAATYDIATGLPTELLETECLGWLLTGYVFDRYRKKSAAGALLVAPVGIDVPRVEAIAAAEVLARDLINTPTSDMGPDKLAEAAEALAKKHGARFNAIVGDDLLEQNFPMIHAVGRASATPPRLIELAWGTEGPKLTLVGKGVCFDTGGLDLKPAASMLLMKKDMGGSANVLGLAHMIMAMELPVQLRVLIPAVENSVAGNAFRPSDILTSRKGLTVEINNTDAEGRLVLADALALAEEDKPDLLISMATLTGAARVAVGPDLAPFFTDHDADAATLSAAAKRVDDPVWRLPFHEPYESKIDPGIADLDNAPSGGFAGATTAAMFLRHFAGEARYMHFDIYAWMPASAPGRPKGGVGQGIRALFEALPEMLDL